MSEITSVILDADVTDNLNALQALIFPAYTAYTPTLTQPGAIAKTVDYASYLQIGKNCRGNTLMKATATGTSTNSIGSSIPAAPKYTGTDPLVIGSFALINSATRQSGALVTLGTTAVLFQPSGTTNALGLSPVYALAVGDVLSFEFDYETV